jgi:hypothetical protein
MVPVSAQDMLATWEAAGGLSPTRRAVSLAAAAAGKVEAEVAELPVGTRDAMLLRLHEAVFGSTLTGLAPCPTCGAPVEFECDAGILCASAAPEPLPKEETVAFDRYDIRLRLPTSADLVMVEDAAETAQAAELLLGRCIRSVALGGTSVSVGELPDAAKAEVGRHLALRDPLADVLLTLACPDCGVCWDAALDIASFVWSEVEAWARHTLDEVHALASAYGWAEADILAMSSRRRQLYLARLGQWMAS